MLNSIDRSTSEINSANDNPLIDHRRDEIIHGGNFQGASITVAMDQRKQALQMCGKMLFGQMSELVNFKLSNGLPPNLSGSDTNTDMGYKGTDIAMASYCSELDYLGYGLTNHVLSTELHNQSVNSLALISARMIVLYGCSVNNRKVGSILMQLLTYHAIWYVSSVVIPFTYSPFSNLARQIVYQRFIHEV